MFPYLGEKKGTSSVQVKMETGICSGTAVVHLFESPESFFWTEAVVLGVYNSGRAFSASRVVSQPRDVERRSLTKFR